MSSDRLLFSGRVAWRAISLAFIVQVQSVKVKGEATWLCSGFFNPFSPLVVAGVLLVVRNNRARNVIVGASALVIGLASVWLVVSYLGAPWITYDFYSPVVDYVCMAVSVLIAAAILYFGIKYKNPVGLRARSRPGRSARLCSSSVSPTTSS